MSDFKGFIFYNPKHDDQISIKDEETTIDKTITDLSFQFSRIGGREKKNKNRTSTLANRSIKETQEKRRLSALEIQKKQRHISVSKVRQIALGTLDADTESDTEEQVEQPKSTKRARDSEDEDMKDVVSAKIIKINPRRKKNDKKKNNNIYMNQIMYAEYLESIPEDFIDNWVTMICPIGKRCLVTSGNGQTIARSRNGNIIKRFQSILPSGSRTSHTSEYCILDCVYDAVHWTFYVLDIMCWKGYPIYDCDTNFRHFWLQTKVELNEFDKPNNENQFYKFIALKPVLTSETQLIAANPEDYLLEKQGFTYNIDGLLFYHRQAHYKGGSTPLVCWVPRDKMYNLI
ncbi:uncharacterized protein BX663DRAFT_527975 [Cokeromyces recurvatus]|uniref:uncharacterized protein n=1 Tax=Cokeromyces recurvatus TaxID=90255 RepID=UPI0022205125|nr:uncharacterized protein BX663DRAFT_527975 [Cokeromyces recurvatus]KAI7897528.1 hypothetical protein BX663DRAFT_527975 [Cokeromyces recurvatus]